MKCFSFGNLVSPRMVLRNVTVVGGGFMGAGIAQVNVLLINKKIVS